MKLQVLLSLVIIFLLTVDLSNAAKRQRNRGRIRQGARQKLMKEGRALDKNKQQNKGLQEKKEFHSGSSKKQKKSINDTIYGTMNSPQSQAETTPDTTSEEDVFSLDKYFQSIPSPDYIFGICDLVADRTLPRRQQSVRGNILFRQSLQGGVTEIYVNVTGLAPPSPRGSAPSQYGLHVHSYGDLRQGCVSTGDHYNPFGTMHGGPQDHPALRHFGDLGNLEADGQGRAQVHLEDYLISLLGPFSALGRAVIVHAGPDDLGTGRTEASLVTGSVGRPLACCVIGLCDTLDWPVGQASPTTAVPSVATTTSETTTSGTQPSG